MTHRELRDYDGHVCAVTCMDGDVLTGPFQVFDLVGDYRNVLVYVNNDCISLEPDEVKSIQKVGL